MGWKLSELFHPEQIEGDPAACFQRVAVGAEQADSESLYLLIEQEYLNATKQLPQAVANGAVIFVGVGDRPPALLGRREVTWVSVPDVPATLQRLAVAMRDASSAVRIGVTGSNGKTTTKDMIAHLLRLCYPRTLKSVRNYNGELGVPLTLRKLLPDDQFLVAEVGMGSAGSVKRRAQLVVPQIAVITNIQESHIVRFGSRKAIAAEKAELVHALTPGGLAVLNGDDDECRRIGQEYAGSVIYFGLGPDCEWRAERIKQDSDGLCWQLIHRSQSLSVNLPLFGRYQVYNALAAFVVADWAGIPPALAALRLQSFRLGEQRGRMMRQGGLTLIDDAYNSNPWSVEQAALALAEWPAPAKWLVLGDMQPLLPEQSLEKHRLLGEFLSSLPLQEICLIGSEVAALAPAYRGSARLQCFTDEEALTAYLIRRLPGEAAVLLKGQDDRLFARILSALQLSLPDGSSGDRQ